MTKPNRLTNTPAAPSDSEVHAIRCILAYATDLDYKLSQAELEDHQKTVESFLTRVGR